MKTKRIRILGIVIGAMLSGCAGQPQQFYIDQSDGPAQSVTFSNGTVFGGASNRQASSLAQIMVDSNNNNNMKDYEAQTTMQEKSKRD